MLAKRKANARVCRPAHTSFSFMIVMELVPQRAIEPNMQRLCMRFMHFSLVGVLDCHGGENEWGEIVSAASQ